jgi:methionyl-tRNA synthetase
VWGLDALTRYDPDALRYYLTVNMPENKDSDWDWSEFVARNNNELVATWGTWRTGSFRSVTSIGKDMSPMWIRRTAGRDLVCWGNRERFQDCWRRARSGAAAPALAEAMKLATAVNQYLDQMAPGQPSKPTTMELGPFIRPEGDRSLKVLFAPFLPFSSKGSTDSLAIRPPSSASNMRG